MEDLIKHDRDGLVPQTPSFENILARIGLGNGQGGFSNLEKLAEAPEKSGNTKANDELMRSYARLFTGNGGPDDAKKILEDLLDWSFRRGFIPAGDPAKHTIEATALFAHHCAGRNSIVLRIISMIDGGRKLPNESAAKKKKSKR